MRHREFVGVFCQAQINHRYVPPAADRRPFIFSLVVSAAWIPPGLPVPLEARE